MKKITLVEGILAALCLSLLCIPALILLGIVFPFRYPVGILIAGVSLVYFFYLLRRLPWRPGKLTAGIISCIAVLTAALILSAPFMVLVSVGCLWMLRSWLRYKSVVCSMVDLAVVGLGLFAGLCTAAATGSLILSLWSFFLVQALFCLIPQQLKEKSAKPPHTRNAPPEDRFERALLSAEQALRRLA